MIQDPRVASTKMVQKKTFPSFFLLGGALFSFLLYLAIWPLVWHLLILPAARPEKHQLRVESYAPHRVDNTFLILDKPDTSLTAYAVWQVPKEGLYHIKLTCDDNGKVLIDNRSIISLIGISPRNVGETKQWLTPGLHFLELRLNNILGQGWLKIEVAGPGQDSYENLRKEQISWLELGNIDTWLDVVFWGKSFCLLGFLGLGLLSVKSFFRKWKSVLISKQDAVKTTDKQLIRANTLILGGFVFFYITKVLYWLPKDLFNNGLAEYAYTDWLIDYSSGFVKRGLSGELIDLISVISHPRVIIAVLGWSIFSVVVFGYIRLLTRSLNTLSPFLFVALLFLPSLLPFYLFDHDAFGRKETIGFLILLWHLYSLETHKNVNTKELPTLNHYIKKLMPITLVLLPAHIFIHEASFLQFVPIHIIITYSIMRLNPSIRLFRRIFNLTLIYLPVLLAFSSIAIFGKPSFEVALAICNKWELAKALPPGSCASGMPAALSLLPWSLSHIASVTMSFSVKTILAWILIFSIMGFSTVYIGCMVVRSLNSNNSTRNSDTPLTRQYIGYKYFLFPWLISTPLYIIGWDFGRWFAISCINYIMITLSRELNYAESRFGNDTETKTEIFNQDPTLGESTLLYHINLVFLFIILFFIRMPYAVNNGYNMLAEPLKSLAESLWHALS